MKEDDFLMKIYKDVLEISSGNEIDENSFNMLNSLGLAGHVDAAHYEKGKQMRFPHLGAQKNLWLNPEGAAKTEEGDKFTIVDKTNTEDLKLIVESAALEFDMCECRDGKDSYQGITQEYGALLLKVQDALFNTFRQEAGDDCPSFAGFSEFKERAYDIIDRMDLDDHSTMRIKFGGMIMPTMTVKTVSDFAGESVHSKFTKAVYEKRLDGMVDRIQTAYQNLD